MPHDETLAVRETDTPEEDARESNSPLNSTGGHQSDSHDEVPTGLVTGLSAQDLGAHSVLPQLDSEEGVGSFVSLRRLQYEESLPAIGRGRERYEVMKTLGVGGMGHVYLVADRDLRRRVAMKLIKPEARSHSRRFVEEAQILSQLDHPNIVPLHNLSLASDGRPYCTMRYVQGRTLAEVLAELRADAEHTKVYTLTRLMQTYQQILQAMSYAHARGVIHRDLKPRNVMLGEHGEVQVVDWGLAKVMDLAKKTGEAASPARLPESSDEGSDRSGLTSAGQVMGTWSHMSPEQAMGQAVDERTDIWALGVILYELLTLELPFSGKDALELRSVLVGQPADAPRKRSPHRMVPLELDALCVRCLEKRSEDRLQRVEDIHAAVQEWLEHRRKRADDMNWPKPGQRRLVRRLPGTID